MKNLIQKKNWHAKFIVGKNQTYDLGHFDTERQAAEAINLKCSEIGENPLNPYLPEVICLD